MKHSLSKFTVPVLAILTMCTLARAADDRIDLFHAGKGGYTLYRIPAIVMTPQRSLLVFCEARAKAGGDWGKIDVLMRRSTDGGKTWDAPRRAVEPPANAGRNPVTLEQKLGATDEPAVGNPVPISDAANGAVHLLYCINYARCFYVRSDDDGKTFSAPMEITGIFEDFRKNYPFRVLATGPGHSIRLKTGRLVVPVWLSTGAYGHGHRPSCIATIYSDDAGKTWNAGDIIANDPNPINPSEASLAELSDGRVMMNIRHEGTPEEPATKDRPTWRAVAIGRDGATGWGPVKLDRALAEPVCSGTLLSLGGGQLLFTNPDNPKDHRRRNLTVRLSSDDGKTWSHKRTLEPGVSGYSDLATSPDGSSIYCFYERGTTTDDRHTDVAALTLLRFNREWITAAR